LFEYKQVNSSSFTIRGTVKGGKETNHIFLDFRLFRKEVSIIFFKENSKEEFNLEDLGASAKILFK